MMNKLLWISLIVTAALVDQGKGSIPLPLNQEFPVGIPSGQILQIHGDLRPIKYRTVINIQQNTCLDPDDDFDIVMHMAMYKDKFVFNHKDGGSFGREESVSYPDSVIYRIKIVAFDDSTIVYSNDQFLYEFTHRIKMKKKAHYLCIYGPSPLDYIDFTQMFLSPEE